VSSSEYAVRLLPVAEQDLQELVSYVAAENVRAALDLTDTIEQSLQTLSAHPFAGRVPHDTTLAALDYRVLVVGNYLIFYKVRGKAVMIHRIVHGARDIPGLLEEP
jgi:toxin ParE1/3/4